MVKNDTQNRTKEECCEYLRPVRDVMDLLNGKWKIPIITVLLTGPYGFNEMKEEIEGISAKMLSKDLKDLQVNELVKKSSSIFIKELYILLLSVTDRRRDYKRKE